MSRVYPQKYVGAGSGPLLLIILQEEGGGGDPDQSGNASRKSRTRNSPLGHLKLILAGSRSEKLFHLVG